MKTLRKNTLFCALAFIAVTLSVMVSATPVWVKSGNIVEICSSFGTKTITIDENGQEIPAVPPSKKHCAFCLTASSDLLAAPVSQITALFDNNKKRVGLNPDTDTIIIKRLRTTNSVRAPPAIS